MRGEVRAQRRRAAGLHDAVGVEDEHHARRWTRRTPRSSRPRSPCWSPSRRAARRRARAPAPRCRRATRCRRRRPRRRGPCASAASRHASISSTWSNVTTRTEICGESGHVAPRYGPRQPRTVGVSGSKPTHSDRFEPLSAAPARARRRQPSLSLRRHAHGGLPHRRDPVRAHAARRPRGDGARRAAPARAPRPPGARPRGDRRRHRGAHRASTSCRCCSGSSTARRCSPPPRSRSRSPRASSPRDPARRRPRRAAERRAAASNGRSRASPSAIALVAFLADLGRWAGDELVGVDPLTFHLPNIGRWIQTGSLWQIDQFVPLLAHGNYPNNGDVVMLSTVLPWHNDFLVRAPICFFLVVTAVAIFAIARELRAPAAASVLAAAAVVSLPIVGLATIPRALPDSLLWATYACGTLFLLRHARTRAALRPRPRRHRARDRLRDEVVRHQLGRRARRRLGAARASRAASRGALRDGAARRRDRARSATSPGWRATSSSPPTPCSP